MAKATNQARLVILITRTQGRVDEWQEVWGFSGTAAAAFIDEGDLTFIGYGELDGLDLNDRLGADVWVFNGMKLGDYRESVYRALDRVAWKDLERGVVLKYHRGGGNSVSDPEFKESIEDLEFQNTKWLLKQAVDYSLDTPADPKLPVTIFAGVVRNEAWDSYPEALKHLGGVRPGVASEVEALPLHVRISLVKHAFQNVLQPLNIDLQGLIETNFRDDYWKEVSKDYAGGKSGQKLERARELLYGGDGAQDTVEAIVNAAGGGDELQAPWQNIQTLFPKDGESPEWLWPLVESLGKSEPDDAKARLKGGDNPLRDWLAKLEGELGKLRKAVESIREGAGPAGGAAGG